MSETRKARNVKITNRIAVMALRSFHSRQDLVDTVASKLTELPRMEAEDKARRMSMSAAVCVAAGISAEEDAELFTNDTWQELIEKLLFVYDSSPKFGERFSDL